jgi:high affinity Mn2+ porin
MGDAAALGVVVLALAHPAAAADLPLKAPALKSVYDWTGFYVGGHFGYGGASFGSDTNPLPLQGVFFPHSPTGLIGGFQVGYNRELANHVVLGAEADTSFTSPIDQAALGGAPTPFNATLDYVGTLRGRIGYAFGRWMPYVTGGFAWGHTHININDDPANGSGVISSVGHYQPGWTAGLGLEFAVSGNWTAELEYDYVDLARQAYDLSSFGLPGVSVDLRLHLARERNRSRGRAPGLATQPKG